MSPIIPPLFSLHTGRNKERQTTRKQNTQDMKISGKKIRESQQKAQDFLSQVEEQLADFTLDVKRDIAHIINDCPTIVRLGGKEYIMKDLRPYSLNRIFDLSYKMIKADEGLDEDNKIITALCTDLDAMCEVVAIILCNHLFTADGAKTYEDIEVLKNRNDKMVEIMKAKVMNSTFDINQWASIIIGAIKSIDLGGFFLLKKSVNMLLTSHMERKKKSVETALQFTEAQSLRMLLTS